MRGEWQDNILYCPVSRSLVVLFATLLDSSSVCWEMKRQLIAFSNQTPIFLCDNVLLSLRPAQNEVHSGHGRAHAGGHAGAGAGAEESHHPHLLRYDAVWAQLQPRTHVWNGKKKKKVISELRCTLVCFVLSQPRQLPAKYDIWDAYDGVIINSLLISLQFENELITKLDQEVEGGRGDEQYKVLLEKT